MGMILGGFPPIWKHPFWENMFVLLFPSASWPFANPIFRHQARAPVVSQTLQDGVSSGVGMIEGIWWVQDGPPDPVINEVKWGPI